MKEISLSIKDFKKELVKRKIKDAINNTLNFCKDYGKEIVLITGILGAATNKVCKWYGVKKEQDLKDRYIYDFSERHYWKMKRIPKTNEWLEINRRKNNGEKYGDILSSMKLL